MTDLPADLTPLVVQGNVLDVLASLPRRAFHCSVFSPPFWGLRRYDVCACSQGYVRGEEEHPMPQKQGTAVRGKVPDPSCPWCHGTGTIPGMETLWGGSAACDHSFTYTPARRPRRAADEGNLPSAGNFDAKGGRLCGKCGGWLGSLGLEPTPALYVEHVVEFFRALRPVLRDDATVWCEIGDTYLTHPAGTTDERRTQASTLGKGRDISGSIQAGLMDKRQPGLREGNLALIPHRVAIALQGDGWIVRQDIPWARPNPMPESIKNRPTRAHSYIFLLAPEPGYYYDQENGREANSPGSFKRYSPGDVIRDKDQHFKSKGHDGANRAGASDKMNVFTGTGRNILSVWTIPTQAFPGKHYATFPTRIPERCIAIGTSDRGCCPECGTPFERVTSLGDPDRAWQRSAGGDSEGEYSGVSHKAAEGTGAQDPSEVKRRILEGMVPKVTVGWRPRCACFPDPCDRCSAPWEHRTALRRVSELSVRERDKKNGLAGQRPDGDSQEPGDEDVPYGRKGYRIERGDVSWPGCRCRPLVAPLVLDPFAGSGTTLLVARRLYRRSVGIELSAYYVDMARTRLAEETRGLAPSFNSQRSLAEFAEAP